MAQFKPDDSLTKAKQKVLLKTYGKIDCEEIKNKISEFIISPSFAYSSKKKDKIAFNSKTYPLKLWVSKEFKNSFEKMGIEAKLPGTVIFEHLLSASTIQMGMDSDEELINYLSDKYASWQNDTTNMLLEWQKKMGTSNIEDTLDTVNQILQGRRKYNEKTHRFEGASDEEIDDYIDEL